MHVGVKAAGDYVFFGSSGLPPLPGAEVEKNGRVHVKLVGSSHISLPAPWTESYLCPCLPHDQPTPSGQPRLRPHFHVLF